MQLILEEREEGKSQQNRKSNVMEYNKHFKNIDKQSGAPVDINFFVTEPPYKVPYTTPDHM